MQLKRIAVNIFAIIVSFLIASVIVGGIIIPYAIARQYDARIKQTALSLEKEFVALEKSTYLSLIDDLTASSAQKQRDAQNIRERITSALNQIAVLERTANSLDPLPFADLANFYHKAQIVREKSLTIASQARTAIKKYGDTVSFLEFYNGIIDDVRAETDTFNTVADFNEFAGQGDRFRGVAAKLGRHAAALEQRTPPHDLAISTSRLKALLDKIATGYESLGYGFDVAIDSNIYSAVAVIEAGSKELETSEGQAYTATLENSRVVKDIRQLGEKLDPLNPSK